MAAYVKKLQEESGLTIVYLPISELDYNGIDARCIDGVGPQEFMWLIKNAEYVLTDSFHACAFSTMFHKQFSVVDRQRGGENVNMSSRIFNLMKMTGIQKGFVNIDEKPCLDGDIDYQDVEKNMQAYRQASEKFLREALEG
ncbi:MAG: polysaccharide pyruvyl transferase family protein [Clostridia bacterium]|nr:polysaccharide pyruvyl transferase family protein [Clostridia bacterium]